MKLYPVAQEAFDKIIEYLVEPISVAAMKEFLNISTLEERLRDQNRIACDFVGTVEKWCRGYFIVLTRDDAGQVEQVVFAVQNINQEKSRVVRQYSVIDALSRNFLNVYLVDLYRETARTLKLEGYIQAGIDDNPDRIFGYNEVMHAYANSRIHEEDRERVLEALNPDEIIRNTEVGQEYNIQYRIIDEHDKIHFYQCRILKTEQVRNTSLRSRISMRWLQRKRKGMMRCKAL